MLTIFTKTFPFQSAFPSIVVSQAIILRKGSGSIFVNTQTIARFQLEVALTRIYQCEHPANIRLVTYYAFAIVWVELSPQTSG